MEDDAELKAKNETNRCRASVPKASPADISILDKWQKQMRSERHLAPLSQQAYGTDASQFAEFLAGRGCDLSSAQAEDVEFFISHLREIGRANRSIARKLDSLRRLYKWMVREKLTDHNPVAFSRVPKTWSNQPLSLTQAEVTEMLDEAFSRAEHFHPNEIALRDSAILELLYGAGIRAEELIGLDLENLDLEAGLIRVRGKGDKERYVPITKAAKSALEKYLSHGRPNFPCPSGSSKNAVFLSKRGSRLTRQWVWRIVKNANPIAHPHRLRHSCASHMVANGARLEDVQELLGHEDISTTDGYTQPVPPEKLDETFRKSHSRAQFKKNPNPEDPEATKGGQDE